jgi:hypothetical protein
MHTTTNTNKQAHQLLQLNSCNSYNTQCFMLSATAPSMLRHVSYTTETTAYLTQAAPTTILQHTS